MVKYARNIYQEYKKKNFDIFNKKNDDSAVKWDFSNFFRNFPEIVRF